MLFGGSLAAAGLVAVLFTASLPSSAPAQAGDTPIETVQTVNDALLHVMENAEALGFQGRQDYLTPVLMQTFEFPAMARLAAGRYWGRFSGEEKRELVTHFTDLSVSTFAARFDGYSGETWKIEGTTEAPRGGTIVENRLITGKGRVIAINYLMHQTEAGDWRIIDVYLDGNISELALRRSEFNSVLRNGGVRHLFEQIAQQVDRLSSQPMQTN
ncbi:ABC transporter substrate-binding protein [Algihabitans albus]|uniref:ABC transporter substrate-binding protein n=1 Tax=Algihabitans albus TaxID=2164067 RepID=UPI0013C32361|nr:ABC transporter substrate-binding protein [Algihabitans albus]